MGSCGNAGARIQVDEGDTYIQGGSFTCSVLSQSDLSRQSCLPGTTRFKTMAVKPPLISP